MSVSRCFNILGPHFNHTSSLAAMHKVRKGKPLNLDLIKASGTSQEEINA